MYQGTILTLSDFPVCVIFIPVATAKDAHAFSLTVLSYFRNLSSISKSTRQQMRMTHGLVESLVYYIQKSVNDSRVEDKVSSE